MLLLPVICGASPGPRYHSRLQAAERKKSSVGLEIMSAHRVEMIWRQSRKTSVYQRTRIRSNGTGFTFSGIGTGGGGDGEKG